jgi:hypothetical protein
MIAFKETFYSPQPRRSHELKLISTQLFREIVEQLTTPQGSEVKLRLEIEAEVPSGLERAKVRTLENANTLGFIEKSVE